MFRVILAFVCLLISVEGATLPRPLADISVPVADGKKIRLSQYRGKVMVVALISTTCEHCITSMQMLGQLQKEYGPQGFQVFSVAADDMAAKMVGPLTRLRQFGFPLGYLDRDTAMQLCDFKPDDHPFVPMYLFVDKKGAVRFQYAGKDDFFKKEEKNTRILIEALLKQ
ncbi:MAG: TlpA family protein disulfide reductase [Acidobacteriia bacterium]|nr:TlpA family protein disulfide reductase [Terriglobia bacterium]